MQVPLEFEFQGNQTFASYFPGNNAEIIAQLRLLATHGEEQQLYVWGDVGSGKTHLLQACCQQAKQAGKDPFYLQLNADSLPSTELLAGLENLELVCFDNLQAIAGHLDWEQALFGFYNAHRQNNHHLLLAADCPPKYLPFELPDLKTRMAWGLTLKIQSLREDQLIEALSYRARFLGFDISPNVGKFLLNHWVHDLPSLWRLLETIDHATLAEQRKLTIPFLKKILSEQLHQPRT
jgi:DnaA family protein